MQALFGGFFAGRFAMLPKRFNVEHRFWDHAHDEWRAEQERAWGKDAVPPTVHETNVLHFVGRDKPWMRLERGRQPERATELCRQVDIQVDCLPLIALGCHEFTFACAVELCRRLRESDPDTCARYLAIQALWWREFAHARCLVVGNAAAGKGQGFVIDAFERVLRMHRASLPAVDVGNQSRGESCADSATCVQAARRFGCRAEQDEILSLGSEGGLPPLVRSLLDDVYQPKHQIFGGPATDAARGGRRIRQT